MQTSNTMKNQILLFVTVCMATLSSFAQFSFVHISDMHVSSTPTSNSDTNAQYFQCAIKEFSNLNPKPAFIIVTGDISDVGNQQPDGMYPAITQHLFPQTITDPAVGDYFIDSDKTIPVYFTPGNHEYWTGFDSIHIPISNDTLFYYPKYIVPDTDYVIKTAIAIIVFLRSGHDSPYGYPPNPAIIMGTGLSNAQCSWLRNILISNGSKRKIIVMHHPPVNAAGTNSDGTPFTAATLDSATNSLQNNRTNFLNICDSNHVDVVLAGHEHQNVVANRKGDTISENWSNGPRYVQTAAAFNRSYRIITVDSAFVTLSPPMRSCKSTGVNEIKHSINISVFPNPADNMLTIGCIQNSEMEILNTEGQILKRLIAKDIYTLVDLSNLSAGIYIIKVKTEEGITVKKFIKQ
jgi:predicted MPP superfamily phosphohydrolase